MSVSSAGVQGNDRSVQASLSSDGRYVAFQSQASNLVPLDTNAASDIFVHDQVTGITQRVSVDSAGSQGNGGSGDPWISSDGRYVAFSSAASNLVPLDTNSALDVFVHDQVTGITERVSVDSAGIQGNDGSVLGRDRGYDGRYVAFSSYASNLVLLDTNSAEDVFVHDQVTGITERVSVASGGVEGNLRSYRPSISSDGRYVTFISDATNLTPLSNLSGGNVFVHDRATGTSEQVSGVGCSMTTCTFVPDQSISADGRYVTYWVAGSSSGNKAFVYDQVFNTTELVSRYSALPTISADGRFVAFCADDQSDLAPWMGNGYKWDVFVRDRATGITRRATLASPQVAGSLESNGESLYPEISADGRHLAFTSVASNLVPQDTNGVADIFVGKLRR